MQIEKQQKLGSRNVKKNICMDISSKKTGEIAHEKTWTCLRKGNLKRNWIYPDSNRKQGDKDQLF